MGPQSYLRYPLDYILADVAKIRVLRVLSSTKKRSDREVAEHAGLSLGKARLALRHLEALNVVQRRLGGGYLMHDHPFTHGLQRLFAQERRRSTEIFKIISKLGSQPYVLSLWIYGSVARGDDRTGSDFDIGLIASVRLNKIVSKVRDDLLGLSFKLVVWPQVVGLDLNDVLRHASSKTEWWQNTTRDAVVLAGEHPSEIARQLLAGELKAPPASGQCPACGANDALTQDTRDVALTYRGLQTTIHAVTGHFCSACQDIIMTDIEGRRVNNAIRQFRERADAEMDGTSC